MQLVYSPHHHQHGTQLALPGYDVAYLEIPQRAAVILEAVVAAKLGPIVAATDHGLAPILAVHDASFVEFLRQTCGTLDGRQPEAAVLFPDAYFAVRGQRHKPAGLRRLASYYAIDGDCPLLPGTWDAAYWSAQAALTAVDWVRSGERAAYALCRPPGHHASVDQYGGYCYLNNAAIAIRSLQASGARPDPAVLTCSLHGDPDAEYPYFWGGREEIGAGAGMGYNRNWPLPPGTTDQIYLEALDQALNAIRDFAPDSLVISAGFDLMTDDPSPEAGGFAITPAGLAEIGQRLAAPDLPTVIIQEGGYRLDRLGSYAVTLLLSFAEP